LHSIWIITSSFDKDTPLNRKYRFEGVEHET